MNLIETVESVHEGLTWTILTSRLNASRSNRSI
jgi:hypothetical protein